MKKICTSILLLLSGSLSLHAQNVNGSMEQWRNYNSGFPLPTRPLEAPVGWHGLDSLVIWGVSFLKFMNGGQSATVRKQLYKSTDSHGGSHAAMLISRVQDTLGLVPGILANAQISVDIPTIMGGGDVMDAVNYNGGLTVSGRVNNVSAWVKYLPKGNDTGVCLAMAALSGAGANGRDSIVGMGTFFIPATSSYTQITVPLVYTDATVTPNKLVITFASSASMSGADSSILYVDDVTVDVAAGIATTEVSDFRCYPNPTNGRLRLETGKDEPLRWTIYDASGKMVYTQSFSRSVEADLANVAPGVYFYEVHDMTGVRLYGNRITLNR
jgi:hypothetical protein